MKLKSILSIFLTCAFSGICVAKDPLFLGQSQDATLQVNNRILAKVNGKAISVIDLMKKMDLLFYRQYPQYATSVAARLQFYKANWKQLLSEMIDKDLILADAQEAKLVISGGDVRQEMESLFGPNIVANLDKIDMSFSEASKMVLEDITIRRMLYIRVHMKAINQVTPQQILNYYESFAKDNIKDNEWIYQLVTIRHRDKTKGAEIANLAYNLLSEENVQLDELASKIDASSESKKVSVTISEELHTHEKDLSDGFKNILVKLKANTYSTPILQKSRSDNSSVFRIFYLKELIAGGIVPFNELESKIKEKLIDDAIERETEAYITKLRLHFDVQDEQLKETIASDFEPFSLK